VERRFLLGQKRKLERAIDAYIVMNDLLENKIILYRELALALRLRIKILVQEIIRRFLILQNKIDELKTWSRVHALKTLENSILEGKIADIKARYEEEMGTSRLEELIRLSKTLTEE